MRRGREAEAKAGEPQDVSSRRPERMPNEDDGRVIAPMDFDGVAPSLAGRIADFLGGRPLSRSMRRKRPGGRSDTGSASFDAVYGRERPAPLDGSEALTRDERRAIRKGVIAGGLLTAAMVLAFFAALYAVMLLWLR